MRAKRLYFNRYLLDLERDVCCGMRTKSFYGRRRSRCWNLIENPHRLVSKDELFAAVWPNVVVTDDTLVQASVRFGRLSVI